MTVLEHLFALFFLRYSVILALPGCFALLFFTYLLGLLLALAWVF
jgi:hypothetical protein